MFPVDAVSAAAGVPSGPRVQLLSAGASLFDFQIADQSGATCQVEWYINNDDRFQTKSGQFGSYVDRYDWRLKGAVADYDVKFHVDSITGNGNGWVSGNSADSWHNCASDIVFRFNMTTAPFAFDANTLNATLEIRDTSTLEVLATRALYAQLTSES